MTTALARRNAISIAAFVRLDLASTRPYAFMFTLSILLASAASAIGRSYPTATLAITASVVTMLCSSTLFSLDERSGLDTYYALSRIPRRRVVLGRYATQLLAAMLGTLLGAIVFIIAALAQQMDAFTNLPETVVGVFAGICWIILIQSPICFRWGYTEARFGLFILAFSVMILVMAAASLLHFFDGGISTSFAVFAFAIATLGALAGSVLLSIHWYERREL